MSLDDVVMILLEIIVDEFLIAGSDTETFPLVSKIDTGFKLGTVTHAPKLL